MKIGVCCPHAGLGNTVSEIDISSARIFSKTLFSMAIPEVMEFISSEPERNTVVLFGIETQVCLQTIIVRNPFLNSMMCIIIIYILFFVNYNVVIIYTLVNITTLKCVH